MDVTHTKELTGGLKRMLTQSKHSDIIIECENKTFNCHKVILAAISPYFETMFDVGLEVLYN